MDMSRNGEVLELRMRLEGLNERLAECSDRIDQLQAEMTQLLFEVADTRRQLHQLTRRSEREAVGEIASVSFSS